MTKGQPQAFLSVETEATQVTRPSDASAVYATQKVQLHISEKSKYNGQIKTQASENCQNPTPVGDSNKLEVLNKYEGLKQM